MPPTLIIIAILHLSGEAAPSPVDLVPMIKAADLEDLSSCGHVTRSFTVASAAAPQIAALDRKWIAPSGVG